MDKCEEDYDERAIKRIAKSIIGCLRWRKDYKIQDLNMDCYPQEWFNTDALSFYADETDEGA